MHRWVGSCGPRMAGVFVLGVFSCVTLVMSLGVAGRCMDLDPRATVALAPSRLNIFFPGEDIRTRLVILLSNGEELTAPVVRYRVTDFWDNIVASGTEELHRTNPFGGWVEIAPKFQQGGELGWFKISLELYDGDRAIPLENPALATGEPCVTFAVIPPPEAGPHPDSFFGICEHGLDEGWAEAMRRAGIRWLRTDVSWQEIQGFRGGPVNWSRLDSIVGTAKDHDIEVLPIIDYTPYFAAQKLESVREGDPSRYPPCEEDWRAFVRMLVERYQDKVRCWEVWNEANTGFWLGTPAQYAALLRQAYEEIKAADPGATVSIAGTAGVALDWIRDVVSAGAGPYMDVVSLHPYMQPAPPEYLLPGLLRARTFTETELPPRADGKSGRELWITEMGYHTLGNERAIPERDQAWFLTRAMVQAMAAGVRRFFWYEFADGGVSPYDQEANFGIVHKDLTPKPAYVAYATMERMLGNGRYSKSLAFDQRWLRAYSFDTPAGNVVVAWSVSRSETVSWPAAGPVTITDIMGRKQRLEPHGGSVELTITESPVYIQGIDLSQMEKQGIALISDDPSAIKPASGGLSTVNLVRNPGFEEAVPNVDFPRDWMVHIRGNSKFSWTYVKDAADAPEGAAYMRLRNDSELEGNVYGRIYTRVLVKPYTNYTISVKVRTKNNRASWIGGGPGWYVRFPLPQDTNGQWETIERTFTTGDETVWELMILLEDVDEQVDIDDVRVYEGVPPGL